MKHASIAALGVLVCMFAMPGASPAAPAATVISTTQSATTRMVSVTFDLSEPAIVTLGAQTSADGGSTWADIDGYVVHVVGDVNKKLAAGNGYTALWDADLDWPGHPESGEAIRPVVRCWTEDDPPDWFVMSLLDKSRRWYFTDARQIPGGVTNRLYKTDYLVMRRIHARDVVWQMGSDSSEPGRMAGTQDGGETPQHYVKLTHDYYMAVFPGTKGQSVRLFSSSLSTSGNPDWFPVNACHHLFLRGYRAASGQPWSYVSGAEDPVAGSNLDKLRAATGLAFDIPTEAQWEFACRAGTATARYDMECDVDDMGWHSGNSGGAIHEVGLKKPNPWGLYDMYGNVTEWCRDYSGGYGTAATPSAAIVDPAGPASHERNYRVKRGGSSRSPAANWFRSARRGYCDQSWTTTPNASDGGGSGSGSDYFSGYRLVIDLPASAASTSAAPGAADAFQTFAIDEEFSAGVNFSTMPSGTVILFH